MDCLHWFVNEELPSPDDIKELHTVVMHMLERLFITKYAQPAALVIYLTVLDFLTTVLKFGVELLKRAMLEAVKDNPVLALLLLLNR